MISNIISTLGVFLLFLIGAVEFYQGRRDLKRQTFALMLSGIGLFLLAQQLIPQVIIKHRTYYFILLAMLVLFFRNFSELKESLNSKAPERQ